MRRMAGLQARLMSDLAQAGEATTWTEASTVVCPACGAEMHPDGQRTRHLQGPGEADFPLHQSYAVCPVSRTGFFSPG